MVSTPIRGLSSGGGWPSPWQPILALDALEQALWARLHRESGRFAPTRRVRKTGELLRREDFPGPGGGFVQQSPRCLFLQVDVFSGPERL